MTNLRGAEDDSILILLKLVAVIVLLAASAAIPTDGYALPQAHVVSITSVSLAEPLAPRRRSVLDVDVHIAAGWHINSNHPAASYYIPTRLHLDVPAGIEAGAPVYPAADTVELAFAAGEKLSVFTDEMHVRVPLVASAVYRSGVQAPASISVRYQACNDQQCLTPTTISKTLDLATLTISGSSKTMASTDGADDSTSWISRAFVVHGYFIGFLIILLGGLALNLTPCVYPLIGVTIAYFGNEAGAPRKVVLLATLYVLGIALMFSSVGVAVALSGGLFGEALQNPFVLSAIAAMLLVLAGSSFGLFTLSPPQWLMRSAGTARPGYAGAILMGLGMGIVAAPCIGPIVLGLLLMVQRSGSALLGFSLFFTLAIGLGLPYIGLALAAGSIRRLPRSGEWLAWVEQLFGFVLVGLAIYFLDPVFPGRIMSRFLPYYAAGAGVFLGFVSPKGRNWQPFLVFKTSIGIASAAALAYLVVIGPGARVELSFQPFERALLETARSQGKPVVLDFSADWCVPCREMEHTTFTDPAVVREARGFMRLRANLTAENSQNRALEREFKIQGVPTTMFIDSNGQIRKRRVGYIGPSEFLEYLRQYG